MQLTLTTFFAPDPMVARVTSLYTGSVDMMTLFLSKAFPTLFGAVLTKRPITAHYKSNDFLFTAYKKRLKSTKFSSF